ncbi:hypothetical protein GUJ93_ZPchr0011g27250 [Zizania palustris]|uniref:Uncharacterized protein n=1 Tax=Zizania palustris TaxID=103762 RepID=A0A8J5WGG6_ZIZPA|nr:hypothetical protein GUJ93_ZPchr0011g27250 [Zizania palustris]
MNTSYACLEGSCAHCSGIAADIQKADASFSSCFRKDQSGLKVISLDELKTEVGHVTVMILLVKMFERSKMVKITMGMDLLSYSVCIFLSSASLYILHNLHRSEHEDSVVPNLWLNRS